MPHLSASLEPPPALVNNLSAYFLQHSLRKLLRWVGVYASECVWSRYPKNKSQSNNFWFLSAGHPPTKTTYNNNTQSRTGHVSKIHNTNTLYIVITKMRFSITTPLQSASSSLRSFLIHLSKLCLQIISSPTTHWLTLSR